MVEGKSIKSIHDIKISKTTFIKENLGKFRDFYKIGHVLGTGSYGQVRKCLHIATKQIRAVKLISKDILDPGQMKGVLDELEILRELDHPNILKMYEYYQDAKRYYLVTEQFPKYILRYCSGGELFDKIIEQMYMTEEEAARVLRQVLSAISYCHDRKIVHRDLKPENLILDSKEKDSAIKIIDFGTAQVFDPHQKMKQKSGTPYYIAPEVLKREYDHKCDIWSAGVILFILLCGYPPFNGANDTEIMKNVLKGKFDFKGENWEYNSAECKDLITKMLTYDPKKRVSAADCLAHSWIVAQGKKDEAKVVKTKLAKSTLVNLQKFRADEKLKQASMTYIVSQLMDEREKKEMQKMFKALDTDGNGRLSKQELIDGYEKVFGEAADIEKVETIFAAVDTDNSGEIDYHEFLVASMNETKIMSDKNLKETFRLMDKDGNGFVDADEIKDVLGIGRDIDEEVWNDILKQVDENGDGVISFEEFCNMMRKFIK